jgi:hypothetical protein
MLSHEHELIKDATGVSDERLLSRIEERMRDEHPRGLDLLRLALFNHAAKAAHKYVLQTVGGNTIEEVGDKNDDLVVTLRKALITAQKALEPLAAAIETLAPDHRDASDIWESPAAMTITAGDLRATAPALTEISAALTKATATA